MPFPQSFLDELIARSDIVDVVSSYVQLTRKGSNLFGLCPFHSEKTGSFSVSPDKKIPFPMRYVFLPSAQDWKSRRRKGTGNPDGGGSDFWISTGMPPVFTTKPSISRRAGRCRNT